MGPTRSCEVSVTGGTQWTPMGLTTLLSSRIAVTSGPYGSERVNFQPPITIILLLVRNLRVGRRFNWRFLNFV